MDNFNFAQQGWQCPICKRVYSPMTPWCYFCGGEAKTWTSTGTGNPVPDLGNTTSSDCWELSPVLLTSNPPKNVWTCKYCGEKLILDVTEMPSKPCKCRISTNEEANSGVTVSDSHNGVTITCTSTPPVLVDEKDDKKSTDCWYYDAKMSKQKHIKYVWRCQYCGHEKISENYPDEPCQCLKGEE